MKTKILLIIVASLFVTQIALAQTAFDYTAFPLNGSSSLWAGFSPEVYGFSLNFGGDINTSEYFTSSECTGYTTSQPTFNLEWNGISGRLSLYFISSWDTAMVIRTPNGEWYCSSNFNGSSPHPYIALNSPEAGTYNIWINAPSANIYNDGELMVTEGNSTPENQSTGSKSQINNGDTDNDGISDETELWLAETFMPVYEYDQEESNILRVGWFGFNENNDVLYLWQVSPVKCGVKANSAAIRFYLETLDSTATLPDWIENSESYLLTVVATYPYDYVPLDLTTEQDLLTHYGDTERVRMCITKDDSNYYSLIFMQINRHHETAFYTSSELTYSDSTHPYLFVSEGKHATFISDGECEGSVSALHIFNVEDPFDKDDWKMGFSGFGWDEDCGGGPVISPTVNPKLNVGEFISSTHKVYTSDLGYDKLTNLYPVEAVWNSAESGRVSVFCGGYDVLLDDYSSKHEVATGYSSPWCGGTLDTKWWPPRSER